MLKPNLLFQNNNIKKLKLYKISWEEIFVDKSILFKEICDLILDRQNLFYYATQRDSSKTIRETKKFVNRMIKNNSIKENIKDIFNNIGWDSNLNIKNTVFQGDLSEYLMNILLDKFTDTNTIISKVSLKTTSHMAVYGNDNVYYDYDKEVLYFGESKFYTNFSFALRDAVKSIEEHKNIKEISYVKNHTTSFIAHNGEQRSKLIEKFEEENVDNIKIKNIIFIINDDLYEKSDYELKLIKYFGNIEEVNQKAEDIIFVFLPILSKTEFLEYFSWRLGNEL